MNTNPVAMNTISQIFNGKNIRRTFYNGEWWFAISDIVEALTDISNSSDTIEDMRKRDIAVRTSLSNEWDKRGVSKKTAHTILVDEISIAAFGLTPSGYKELKGLERENLRDHMSDLELIFSMLGEAATTEIARKQDAQGFDENRTVARKGGRIAGGAREKLEQETGEKILNKDNYLTEPESRRRLATKACNS